MKPIRLVRGSSLLAALAVIMSPAQAPGQEAAKPVVVKFHQPKTEEPFADLIDSHGPIDPEVRVNIQPTAGMGFGLNAENVRLTFGAGSIQTLFKIDGQIVRPSAPQPMPLAGGKGAKGKGAKGKAAHGFTSSFKHGNLTITQTIEAAPTRPSKPGAPRRLNAALVRFVIENKDAKPHALETRVRIDTHCNNDGALFAAPTFPNKILDGIELKDKTLPPYVQILQVPNLKNPGATGHFTLRLGGRLLGPARFVCTAHGAADNGWEIAVRQAMGDSDCAMYWKPVTIQAGAGVTLAYAYGIGLVGTPRGDSPVRIAFGGSFEPHKLFTISAYVDDAAGNETLDLDLPPGIELIEGKRLQPVPQPPADSPTSVVLWKCRVRELGEHTMRIRSGSGVTHTRTVTIARP